MLWLDQHATFTAEALICVVLLKVVTWAWASLFGKSPEE